MEELLEVKNKIESLILQESKNCCTNLKDEIKFLKEEISLNYLIIKILAENTCNSGNNINISPCRRGNFQNLNSRCSDRLKSSLQNDVVNLKKSVKKVMTLIFKSVHQADLTIQQSMNPAGKTFVRLVNNIQQIVKTKNPHYPPPQV